jgi:hypothetical protein
VTLYSWKIQLILPLDTSGNNQQEDSMQVNETMRTYDLAEALCGECGKFEVTSMGTRLIVTAIPGQGIANLRMTNEGGSEQVIWIRKVADFQAQPNTQYRSQAA